jgi:hypothetical protein
MARQSSGTGKGGKSFQDRKLAAEVRSQVLTDINAVLTEEPEVTDWTDYKKQLVLKMAPSVLPRLNEVTGDDGGPVQVNITSQLAKIYGGNAA